MKIGFHELVGTAVEILHRADQRFQPRREKKGTFSTWIWAVKCEQSCFFT